MTPQDELSALDTEVDRLERALDADKRSSRRTTRLVAGTSLAILLAISGVLYSGWSTLRQEWTQENLSKALSQEMQRLSPMAAEQAMLLGKNLLPVFAQHGAEQLEAHSDQIHTVFGNQLDALLSDLRGSTANQMEDLEQHIRAGTEQLLIEQYPELDDPQQRALLVTTFMAAADDAIKSSMQQFVRQYSREVDAFADAVSRFDMLGEDVPTAELQRRLIHLWLQAIDERVMNS